MAISSLRNRELNFDNASCLTLIGIAGAGKTTLGRPLSERIGFCHFDTDQLIESYFGDTLQHILESVGLDEFLAAEEYVVSAVQLQRSVISTGGSVVYSQRAMDQLSSLGPVVYLRIGLATFLERVGRADDRGFVKPSGKTLEDVYAEREPLYRNWADYIIETDKGGVDSCVRQVAAWCSDE